MSDLVSNLDAMISRDEAGGRRLAIHHLLMLSFVEM